MSTYRYDPYKNFKFRVKWDGSYVAGFSKLSGLSRGTQVIDHRSGGDPDSARIAPRAGHGPIMLERGVTYDAGFEQWANKLWYYSNAIKGGVDSDPTVSLRDFRKDIVIELYNEAGQKVIAYIIRNSWPSEFSAIPELDGSGNAVAIQTMTLQNEGWERDIAVPDSGAPSFNLP
jgi:phage tail-like protein